MKHFLEREKEAFDKAYRIETIGDFSEQLIPNSCEKEPVKDFLTSSHTRLIEEVIRICEEDLKIIKEVQSSTSDVLERVNLKGRESALDSIITKLKEGI